MGAALINCKLKFDAPINMTKISQSPDFPPIQKTAKHTFMCTQSWLRRIASERAHLEEEI